MFLETRGISVVDDTQGMIMMSVLDCFETPFYLGEVLARQVKVGYTSHFGSAVVTGDSFEDGFITAVNQLAYNTDNHEFLTLITDFIKENAHYRNETEMIDRGIAASTKVNFGCMVEG
jgi:hypothetical protein